MNLLKRLLSALLQVLTFGVLLWALVTFGR